MCRLGLTLSLWMLCASIGCSSSPKLPDWMPPELPEIADEPLDASVGDAAAANGGARGDASQRPDAALGVAEAAQDAGPDKATQPVTIRFKAKIGDRDFACGQTYGPLGKTKVKVEPADMRFFIQDLRLLNDAGHEETVELKERSPWQTTRVGLIDLEDKRGACSQGTEDTNDIIEGLVLPGHYNGVVFTNGVPEQLNHADPVLQAPPLQATDLTWGWLTGFKFFLAELHEVAVSPGTDADGGMDRGGGVGLVHVGSTDCKGNPQAGRTLCQRGNRNDIKLTDFDPEKNVIVVDIGKLFENIDLSADSQCHSTDAVCAELFLKLGVDFTSGRAVELQEAYHVE